MLKDEEEASDDGKVLIIKESKESSNNNSFKDYIKICSELGLIPSWVDFEKYTHIKKCKAQPRSF